MVDDEHADSTGGDRRHARRRDLLSTVGGVVGASGVTGVGGIAGCLQAPTRDGPPGSTPPSGWDLLVDEQWTSFDEDRWSVGFIDHEDWIPDDDATVSADHVVVEDGRCRLVVESRGTGADGCFQGVINASPGGEPWHPETGIPIEPDPPHYVEARLRFPGREGILPAFWMHAGNTNWPPEIGVAELFQRGEPGERRRYVGNVHWSDSGRPADPDTHRQNLGWIDGGADLTKTFHDYGCAWYPDRVEWYFDGRHVLTRSGPPELLETLTHPESRPFGMILSNHVNRLGSADLSTAWTEELVVDRVRVWRRGD